MKGIYFGVLLVMSIAGTYAYDEDAYWEYSENRFSRDIAETAVDDMAGQQLKILVKEFPPYVMCDKSSESSQADKKCNFTGLIPDLLYQMSKKANFEISFVSNEKLDDHSWDGMINALSTNEEYDMVAAPIQITANREKKVDFLQPFAHVRISVIIQKPEVRREKEKDEKRIATAKKGNHYHEHEWEYQYNIGEPFAPETWVTASAMLIVVWLLMACMNKYNPYEHGWRYDNELGTEDDSKLFSLTGALWYVFSTLQLQGYDRRPSSRANRLLSCFWMSFSLITIISYIGSAANHMFWADSVRRFDPTKTPIIDKYDLINHEEGYAYGTIKNSTAYKFITEGSQANWAKTMKSYFDGKGGKHLVDSEVDGYNMLRTSRYALLVEDNVAQYEMSKEPCDIMDTGIKLGMFSYGFAIKQNNTNKAILNKVTLSLIESDYLGYLEQNWFAQDAFCSVTDEMKRHMDDIRSWRLKQPGRISFHEFWSAVVLIVVGISVSIIVAGIEIFWYKSRGRYRSAYYSGSNWETSS